MRILIIEDQKNMAEAIEYILKKNNYIVDFALDGEEGLDLALTDIYDLILLDVMLPTMDGFTILKKIRKQEIHVPVIMLTAKGEVEDKCSGLDLGADDYLAKPFQTEELLARIRAILRRKNNDYSENVLTFENIELNVTNLKLKCDENEYDLTLKESQVLELLMVRAKNIVSKDILIDKIWGLLNSAIDNNVEVYVSFLRKKLESMNANVKIKTIRGVGYSLVEKEEEKDV